MKKDKLTSYDYSLEYSHVGLYKRVFKDWSLIREKTQMYFGDCEVENIEMYLDIQFSVFSEMISAMVREYHQRVETEADRSKKPLLVRFIDFIDSNEIDLDEIVTPVLMSIDFEDWFTKYNSNLYKFEFEWGSSEWFFNDGLGA
jgi:hypothetical protein